MSKMTINKDSKRFQNFSVEEQDLVKAGVELHKHNLFLKHEKKHFAEFAVGNYDEKQELFMENLEKEAVKRSGFNANYTKGEAMKKKGVREEAFAIIGEILDVILPATVAESMGQFATVRNGAWGDSFLIDVPNNDLFVVSELADGIAYGKPQRLHKNQVPLIPTNKNITIEEDFYRIIAGKVNLGDWLVRVAISYETKLYADVYNVINGTYATLPARLKVANFTQDSFVKLAQTVSAINGGAKAVAFGTQLALSKIIPSDSSFKFGLGSEYNSKGYLGEFMGTSLICLPQVAKAQGDGELLLNDDTVIVVAQGAEKIVAVGFEGETLVFEKDATENASLLYQYSFNKKYDMKAISSFAHGILKLA